MTFKVQTYNNIANTGLDRLRQAGCQIVDDASAPDAIILRSHKLQADSVPSSALAIARAGAGVNNIPVADMSERGIVVFNTPGANANAVKELIAAAMLLASRDIVGGVNYAASLDVSQPVEDFNRAIEAEKKRFAGSELFGKTLGVVGLGAIGSLVANMALDLGMKVLGYDPAISVEAAWRLSSRVQKMETLSGLLGGADYVSLHVPDLPKTRGMIDTETLRGFKTGATLLNFARAGIIDEVAVIQALKSGQLGRYVCDFPSPGLMAVPGAICLPHLGASTAEAEQNCALMAAEQLADFLLNGNIRNSVNFPATAMDRNGGVRITFCNENVPRVLGDVLGLLADANNNVIDLVNRSHDTVAYNIIDVEDEPGELLEAIAAVPHVTRVRRL